MNKTQSLSFMQQKYEWAKSQLMMGNAFQNDVYQENGKERMTIHPYVTS